MFGALMTIALIAGGGIWLYELPAAADEPFTLALDIQTSDTSDLRAIGEECGAAGLESDAADYPGTRQLVVRDAAGVVIATQPLTRGVLEEGIWGRVCSIDITLDLPDSPFFTLTIREDDWEYTFSREVLRQVSQPLVLAPDNK